jgi:putative GTP pyrophosphokinase
MAETTASVAAPTVSQVNKAGRIIRKAYGKILAHTDISDDELDRYEDALDVLLAFRAAHAAPLRKATMGLRSMVKTAGCNVEVSQRLKRVPTILEKLVDEPTMQLANMQDIGGCRSVLESVAEIRKVERRVRNTGRVRFFKDYIKTPRASGYRGVHLIVEYDARRIEIQLRTQVMHQWAITVERTAGRLQEGMKRGKGPEPVLELFAAISEAMALEEEGQVVDSALVRRIRRLREAAVPWIPGGTR